MQLDLVDKYCEENLARHSDANPKNIIDLYTVMYLPDNGGYGQDETYVIVKKDEYGYSGNSGLDVDGNGEITRKDLENKIEKEMEDYRSNLR